VLQDVSKQYAVKLARREVFWLVGFVASGARRDHARGVRIDTDAHPRQVLQIAADAAAHVERAARVHAP
jgi:hypothetical protein